MARCGIYCAAAAVCFCWLGPGTGQAMAGHEIGALSMEDMRREFHLRDRLVQLRKPAPNQNQSHLDKLLDALDSPGSEITLPRLRAINSGFDADEFSDRSQDQQNFIKRTRARLDQMQEGFKTRMFGETHGSRLDFDIDRSPEISYTIEFR